MLSLSHIYWHFSPGRYFSKRFYSLHLVGFWQLSILFTQDFLQRYGYLGRTSLDSQVKNLRDSNPEEAFVKAVRMYQKFNGLNITGSINSNA